MQQSDVSELFLVSWIQIKQVKMVIYRKVPILDSLNQLKYYETVFLFRPSTLMQYFKV